MSTILICGHRAYAAKGLKTLLETQGHSVLEFSRGDITRDDNTITGAVADIATNPLITESVDVVINFILIQNGTISENEAYIQSLLDFCKNKGVRRLIHISSISSYANDEKIITESTPIDPKPELKGGYGALKVGVDRYLESKKTEYDFDIIFVRPGYIVAEDNPHPLSGIAKLLPLNFAILMGDSNSTLPLMQRSDLHQALAKIAMVDEVLPCYLLLEDGDNTKLSYVRSITNRRILTLPRRVFVSAAWILKSLHIFKERQYRMVKGVFKVNAFDNHITKNNLNL